MNTTDCMKRSGGLFAGVLASLMFAGAVQAQTSPVGLWRSIDDHSGKAMALIRISDNAGTLQGRIEKLFGVVAEAPVLCDKCSGARKDQPVIGMTIIDGMHHETDSKANAYSGGTILDPDNGVVYKSRIALSEDGRHLMVRGYVGLPLFGRTQTWIREP